MSRALSVGSFLRRLDGFRHGNGAPPAKAFADSVKAISIMRGHWSKADRVRAVAGLLRLKLRSQNEPDSATRAALDRLFVQSQSTFKYSAEARILSLSEPVAKPPQPATNRAQSNAKQPANDAVQPAAGNTAHARAPAPLSPGPPTLRSERPPQISVSEPMIAQVAEAIERTATDSGGPSPAPGRRPAPGRAPAKKAGRPLDLPPGLPPATAALLELFAESAFGRAPAAPALAAAQRGLAANAAEHPVDVISTTLFLLYAHGHPWPYSHPDTSVLASCLAEVVDFQCGFPEIDRLAALAPEESLDAFLRLRDPQGSARLPVLFWLQFWRRGDGLGPDEGAGAAGRGDAVRAKWCEVWQLPVDPAVPWLAPAGDFSACPMSRLLLGALRGPELSARFRAVLADNLRRYGLPEPGYAPVLSRPVFPFLFPSVRACVVLPDAPRHLLPALAAPGTCSVLYVSLAAEPPRGTPRSSMVDVVFLNDPATERPVKFHLHFFAAHGSAEPERAR
ncbi:hypothetical protein DIPPA_13987 [Diplonema papillatum]|nr:hypothetical protein DIPPA_13987 [Diplonema papillatum]